MRSSAEAAEVRQPLGLVNVGRPGPVDRLDSFHVVGGEGLADALA